jgi:hypothetical protein
MVFLENGSRMPSITNASGVTSIAAHPTWALTAWQARTSRDIGPQI